MTWRPSGSWETLRLRARLLARAREFLGARGLVEVETPALVAHAVTDPHLANVPVSLQVAPGRDLFLHTSPEYHMKRLLAAGAPDIFALCRVFRDGERGPRHEPEFTMVEWYRRGIALDDSIRDACDLLAALAGESGVDLDAPRRWTYQQLFVETTGIDPLSGDAAGIARSARELLGPDSSAALGADDDAGAWLDLLMTHRVAPALAGHDVAVVTAYPADQAALARIDPADGRVAERFEVFCRGLEVANGYRELVDPDEQARRFEADRAARRRLGRPDVAPDTRLLAALRHGLPDCSGVALGFDRTLMALLGCRDIREVMAFPALED